MTEETPKWISLDDVIYAHEEAIQQFGGLGGVRDINLLESALARPQMLHTYGNAGLHELAATYAESIAKNHPFIDGNKRTAFLASASFLNDNGYVIHAPDIDIEDRMVGLANGDVSREQMADFLKSHSVPIQPDNSMQSAPLKSLAEESRTYPFGKESLSGHHPSGSVGVHTMHGVGAASLAINTAEGNFAAAGMDAAGMLAENHTVQKLAIEAIEDTGLKAAFKFVAQGSKRLPLVGAVVTGAAVLWATGAHAYNGEYKLAAGEFVAGSAEAAGNIFGFGVGDVAREGTRQGLILAGGDHMARVEKSGLRQLGEGAYALGEKAYDAVTGKPVSEVLPTTHSSMTPGADEMGNRSEIKRIAVERTGLAANDPRNDIQTLLNENKWRPMGHLLILADGTVQGPEQGAIPFENNPRIAAGKNGETFGVMYAGQGTMNDAQASTFAQVADHLMHLRAQDGLPKDIEVIAGSTNTAELLNLPTPRGPLPNAETPQTTPQLQRRQNNSLGGF